MPSTSHSTERGRPQDIHTPIDDRVRTLEHVGRILCTMGLSSKPLNPRQVLVIERRALLKVKRGLRQ